MIRFLASVFIKNKDMRSDETRRKYGLLCGACGIFLNLLLFALKIFVGTLTGSVAVTADAVNNISDAGSSVVTMVGFRLAGKKPDPEHPFGHGRIEYISGLIVAMLIFVMGFELLSSSVGAITDPKPTELSVASVVILAISVVIKLYMFFYNRAVGKKIGSAAMVATASDSIGDAIATLAVLVSLAVMHFTDWMIDGYIGLLVAGFILFAGYRAAKETIEPLLGMRPEKELIDELFLRIDERIHNKDTWVEAIVVGGCYPNGESAVNPLTYIMIESIMDLNITHPSVYIRFPENPPEKLVDISSRFMLSGNNRAQILYDKTVIDALVKHGVEYRDAVEYDCGGCMEIGLQGMSSDYLWVGWQNTPKMLELMITDGVCLVTGKQYSLENYVEHALEEKSSSKAASYVCIVSDNKPFWGAGIHTDIMTSSVRALVSAVNRMLEKQ